MNNKVFDYIIGVVAVAAMFLLTAENTAFGDAHTQFFRIANLLILIIFVADVLFRLVRSADKTAYLKRNFYDLIVFVPLIQFVPDIESAWFFVVARQTVVVTMLLSRSRRAGRLINLLSLRPAQMMIISFLFAISLGTILLMLPLATTTGQRTSLVDAVFTATSATCVTGLIVQDTATHFSHFGQLVILALIQVGGLGIMTFSVSLAIVLGRRMDVQQRAAIRDMLDQDALAGLRKLVLFIVAMTFLFELFGAIMLFLTLPQDLGTPFARAYHAIFHAVSAFCNAGFSTFSDNLAQFGNAPLTNAIFCFLIIGGGLGFLVIYNIVTISTRTGKAPAGARRLRVQSRIVLSMSAILIVGGTLLVYFFERNRLFDTLSTSEAILASLFQSVTARTAGFNTCDTAGLSSATLLLTIVLMFIGGSPGSTAGGIKTTTIAVLGASVLSGLKHKAHAELYRRTIPARVIQKAVIVLCLALTTVLAFALALAYVEQKQFLSVLFETVSAFATVGLSTGITDELTVPGRLIITALMFVGRLGPLTIAYAFARGSVPARYEYPEERIMIG